MALALPVLLQALWLHVLDVSIYTVLPPHSRPEHMEAALARCQLLPLGTRRIQEQPQSLRIDITERHGSHFGAPLGRHSGEKAHVYMGIVTLSRFFTCLNDLCDRVQGYSPLTFPPDTTCVRRHCAAAPRLYHATQSRRSGGRSHGVRPAGPYGRFVPPARSSSPQR